MAKARKSVKRKPHSNPAFRKKVASITFTANEAEALLGCVRAALRFAEPPKAIFPHFVSAMDKFFVAFDIAPDGSPVSRKGVK